MTDDEAAEMRDDIDNLMALHHDTMLEVAAVRAALLTVITSIDDKMPGMRQIILDDLHVEADRQYRALKSLASSPNSLITADDIGMDMEAMHDIITSIAMPERG